MQPIQDVYALLAVDDERNQLIIEDVIAAVQAQRAPVVLTERREHLDSLAHLLSQRIHASRVIVMAGGMGKKQRKQLMEKIASIPGISRASLLQRVVTWVKDLTMHDLTRCSWLCRSHGAER